MRVGKLAEPHALSVAAAISRPLVKRPKHVRDTVGWLAAWSLFVGASFAVFVFFIRTPPSPVSNDPQVRLADEHAGAGHTGEVVRHGLPHIEEPAADAHGASEGAEAGGHGEAKPKGKDARKSDAKKSTPKKKETKKKPDAHASEGAPAQH